MKTPPPINLAKCKIGQRVRLRNGEIAIIEKFREHEEEVYPWLTDLGECYTQKGWYYADGENSRLDIVALLPLPKKKAKAKNRNIDTNNQHKDIYSRKPNTLDRFTSAFAKIAFKGDNDLIRKAAEQLEGLLKP